LIRAVTSPEIGCCILVAALVPVLPIMANEGLAAKHTGPAR
jgi:hypothetical protein